MKADKSGIRYGLLTIVSSTVNGKVLVQCDCESQLKELDLYELQAGRITDCGCVQIGSNVGVWVVYGERFRSLDEAAKARGVRPSTVRKWCLGKNPRADCRFEPIRIKLRSDTHANTPKKFSRSYRSPRHLRS